MGTAVATTAVSGVNNVISGDSYNEDLSGHASLWQRPEGTISSFDSNHGPLAI